MKYRIAAWAIVGLSIAGCWALYAFANAPATMMWREPVNPHRIYLSGCACGILFSFRRFFECDSGCECRHLCIVRSDGRDSTTTPASRAIIQLRSLIA
jgi:hypothetical protein